MNISVIFIVILLLGFTFIATAFFTKINRAAVAMFMAVVGWILYICYGSMFVIDQHPRDFLLFLMGDTPSAENVKLFIAQNIFVKYVGVVAEVVFFILATMTIVQILDTNGCFDFISNILRTRSSRKIIWLLAGISFALSCSIDNVTVTMMMLVIMHKMVSNRQHRVLYGCAILIAATCGGCMTVIGDFVGLVLWSREAVTATTYTATLLIPCMLAAAIPIALISRKLPEREDLQAYVAPFRGDDTRLRPKEQIMLFVVSFLGLWLVPTFTKYTHLSPFLGALCVLALVWVVNESLNRKLINSDQMVQLRRPRAIQYISLQNILYVIGIMLTLAAVKETGYLTRFASFCGTLFHNDIFILGTLSGVVSTFLDTFTTAVTSFEMYDVTAGGFFVADGPYWPIISFCTAIGGMMFCVGSMSGITFMKMEKVSLKTFISKFTGKIFLGWLVGMLFLYAEIYFFNIWEW